MIWGGGWEGREEARTYLFAILDRVAAVESAGALVD